MITNGLVDGLMTVKKGLYFYTPISDTRLDSDARMFLNTVSPYDNVCRSKSINYLVKRLKAEGFWNKNGIFLPFYGASEGSYKVNLLNTQLIANILIASQASYSYNDKYLNVNIGGGGASNSSYRIIFDNFNCRALINDNESIGMYASLDGSTGQAFCVVSDGVNNIQFYGNTGITSYHARSYNSSSATTIDIGANMVVDNFAYHSYNRISTAQVMCSCNDYFQSINFSKTNQVPDISTVTFLTLASIYYFKGSISSIYLLSNINQDMHLTMKNILENYHYLK